MEQQQPIKFLVCGFEPGDFAIQSLVAGLSATGGFQKPTFIKTKALKKAAPRKQNKKSKR